jgi:hypothetical protein
MTRPMQRADLSAWRWPVDPAGYDRSPVFTSAERDVLTSLGAEVHEWRTGHGAEWAVIEPYGDLWPMLVPPWR